MYVMTRLVLHETTTAIKRQPHIRNAQKMQDE